MRFGPQAMVVFTLFLLFGSVAAAAAPAGVSITEFFPAGGTVRVNSTLPFIISLQNNGTLAATPITVTLATAGATSHTTSVNAGALVPGQSEILFVFLANLTGFAGAYTATAQATYSFGGTQQLSNAVAATYNVSSQFSAYSLLPSPQQIASPIPYISFTEMPFLSSLQGNRTVLPAQTLAIKNELNSTENISITVPAMFSSILHFSQTQTSIAPGHVALIGVSVNIQDASVATYSIPVSINVNVHKGVVNVTGTEYFIYDVLSGTQLSVLSQASASLGNATVTLAVFNPLGADINNATLTQVIPPGVVSKTSRIIGFGGQSNVSEINGTARVSWPIQSLPSGKNIAFSYLLLNATDPGLLSQAQSILYVASKPAQNSILKITKIRIPTFYADSDHNITVDLLYTGTREQNVTLTLLPYTQINVPNAVQVVPGVMPNTQFERNFSLQVGNMTGTFLLTLDGATKGASINYSIPLVVLQSQAVANVPNNGPQQNAQQISLATIEFAVAAIVGVVLLLMFVSKLIPVISRIPSLRRPKEASVLKRLRARIGSSDRE